MHQENAFQSNWSFAGDILAFLRQNNKRWLFPIIVVIALVGVLMALCATGLAPFIYPIF